MPPRQQVLDSFVRHRIDVQRFARGQVLAMQRLLGEEDAELAALLRRRLPGLKQGAARSASMRRLIADVTKLRSEAMRGAREVLRGQVVEFAKVEVELVGQMMARVVGADVFDGVGADVLQAALRMPFSAGRGVSKTMTQWFGDAMRADRQRIQAALQHAAVHREAPADTLRRIVGTKAQRYADGLLAATRRDLEVAVQTSINFAANQATMLWADANAAVVLGLQWLTMLDGNVCEFCAAQEGRVIPVGDRSRAPRGLKLVTSSPPPIHPRDRCALVPLVDTRAIAKRLTDAA